MSDSQESKAAALLGDTQICSSWMEGGRGNFSFVDESNLGQYEIFNSMREVNPLKHSLLPHNSSSGQL